MLFFVFEQVNLGFESQENVHSILRVPAEPIYAMRFDACNSIWLQYANFPNIAHVSLCRASGRRLDVCVSSNADRRHIGNGITRAELFGKGKRTEINIVCSVKTIGLHVSSCGYVARCLCNASDFRVFGKSSSADDKQSAHYCWHLLIAAMLQFDVQTHDDAKA